MLESLNDLPQRFEIISQKGSCIASFDFDNQRAHLENTDVSGSYSTDIVLTEQAISGEGIFQNQHHQVRRPYTNARLSIDGFISNLFNKTDLQLDPNVMAINMLRRADRLNSQIEALQSDNKGNRDIVTYKFIEDWINRISLDPLLVYAGRISNFPDVQKAVSVTSIHESDVEVAILEFESLPDIDDLSTIRQYINILNDRYSGKKKIDLIYAMLSFWRDGKVVEPYPLVARYLAKMGDPALSRVAYILLNK